jgi:predicted DNA-binding transcriptional regulator YafY
VVTVAKEKILYVLEILKKTDEEHALTLADIVSKLKLYGVEAERKSVSRDIQAIVESGYSVLSAGRREGYYLAEREFEDYELVMMNLAVAGARFITEKDSRVIMRKLRDIAAPGLEKLLRETVVDGAIKTDNSAAKYAIDKIVRAIRENKKLTFQFFEYDPSGQKKLRREGHVYSVSPFYMVWVNEELYMLANPDSHQHLTHFVVSMMTAVKLKDEPRRKPSEVAELAEGFDLGQYIRNSVNMYTGETVDITLRCKNNMLQRLMDRFGHGIIPHGAGADRFTVTVKATDANGVCQWIMQYGDKIEVLSPPHIREKLKSKLAAALVQYE